MKYLLFSMYIKELTQFNLKFVVMHISTKLSSVHSIQCGNLQYHYLRCKNKTCRQSKDADSKFA